MGLYLPYADWPESDRALWAVALASGSDPFDDCPTAHLADRTRRALQYAYAKFLFFIASEHKNLLDLTPAERVSRKTIEGYVKSQPATCGPVTLANYLNHLWLALRCICPVEDWSWLLTISKRVRAQARSKPKRHPANVRGVKDLLGHAGFAETEGHYIMAQPRLAGRALAKAIEEIMQSEGRANQRSRCGCLHG